MASLLSTSWKFTADNHDFTSFVAEFNDDNQVKITFSTNPPQTYEGYWVEGSNGMVFHIRFRTVAGEDYFIVGNHYEGEGSGTALIEWSNGVQRSQFHMQKLKS